MPRKRDESRAAEAVRLYRLGLDTRAVAAQLGADPRTVARWVGDEVRRRGSRGRLDVRDQRIADLRAEGLSFEKIARRVHMSKTGVRKRVAALDQTCPDPESPPDQP